MDTIPVDAWVVKRTGGQPMRVVHIFADGRLWCMWRDPGGYHGWSHGYFSPDQLRLL